MASYQTRTTHRPRVLRSWYDQDVHTGWRRLYCYTQRAGVTSWAKTMTNRRERREGRREIQEGMAEWRHDREDD